MSGKSLMEFYLAKIGVPQNEIDDIMSIETPDNSEFIMDDYLFSSEGEL